MDSLSLLLIYFAAVNIIGFALMGNDKRRARKNAFRIPEATLFAFSLIGGSIGMFIGMYTFRHKTKHLKFKIGIPVIIFVQVLFIILLRLSPLHFSFI
ncbi:MAG: DUF1294 domain-containing protein [Butyrivibrio sp.]|jgi:uncharacterized membrane protein YsdA (DUF1294 family)|nr:DUF1294 domain-containing protein [Butyrivibrio sp.]MBQ4219953.1 DUF1294 domain-containing protein [Butyrivibrio sp.]MBR4358423.1 DUF1294 domain-containing protein [Butyrivibrio sp.]MEE3470658.1 DUF1294 domain-containing protein [Butyrivibrio hungatei]